MADHIELSDEAKGLIRLALMQGATVQQIVAATKLPQTVIEEVANMTQLPTAKTKLNLQPQDRGYIAARSRELHTAGMPTADIGRLISKEVGRTISYQTIRASLMGSATATSAQRQEDIMQKEHEMEKLEMAKELAKLPAWTGMSKMQQVKILYNWVDMRPARIADFLGVRDQLVSNYLKKEREARIANGGVIVCSECGRPLHSAEHKAAGIGPKCAVEVLLRKIDTRRR